MPDKPILPGDAAASPADATPTREEIEAWAEDVRQAISPIALDRRTPDVRERTALASLDRLEVAALAPIIDPPTPVLHPLAAAVLDVLADLDEAETPPATAGAVHRAIHAHLTADDLAALGVGE